MSISKLYTSPWSAAVATTVMTLVLIVPNVILAITGNSGLWVKLANILLPGGIYLLLAGVLRRNYLFLPLYLILVVWCSFQIVLIFLYGGGSPIGVDMLLNVVTTNASEAGELLANLGSAIAVVVLLYLPPLVWLAIMWCRHSRLNDSARGRFLTSGAMVCAGGVIAMMVNWAVTSANPLKTTLAEIFPVNVFNNVHIALERTRELVDYPITSAEFTYNSTIDDARRQQPQIAVMVIGETSRACNWQLGGYERTTNPRLSHRDGLVFFGRAFSESNTTHKSVPMLISPVSAPTFNNINRVKSIITAYNEAGFHTAFISNQAPNHSYTEYFGNEAHDTVYLTDTLSHHRYDIETLPVVDSIIAAHQGENMFFVIHTYGSHFKYHERYPVQDRVFTPDNSPEADNKHRAELLNGYDNSIIATDRFIDSLCSILNNDGRPASLLYAADHGEDIFDDSRNRFLHASPTPTYYQLHVAMLAWLSDSYTALYPERYNALVSNSKKPASSTQALFHTSLDLAGVGTHWSRPWKSVASTLYNPTPHLDPVYLNDLNEAITLEKAGISRDDRTKFAIHGISIE